jgi:hypothetical protein
MVTVMTMKSALTVSGRRVQATEALDRATQLGQLRVQRSSQFAKIHIVYVRRYTDEKAKYVGGRTKEDICTAGTEVADK